MSLNINGISIRFSSLKFFSIVSPPGAKSGRCQKGVVVVVHEQHCYPAQDEEGVGDVDDGHAAPGVARLQEQRGGDHNAHSLRL